MAAAACYQGQCLRVLCQLQTISQEVSFLQEIDVELEICANRLHDFLRDRLNFLDDQEITWHHANGGRESTQQDCDVPCPACLPGRKQVHGVQEGPAQCCRELSSIN